jgi:hypothetical protein
MGNSAFPSRRNQIMGHRRVQTSKSIETLIRMYWYDRSLCDLGFKSGHRKIQNQPLGVESGQHQVIE